MAGQVIIISELDLLISPCLVEMVLLNKVKTQINRFFLKKRFDAILFLAPAFFHYVLIPLTIFILSLLGKAVPVHVRRLHKDVQHSRKLADTPENASGRVHVCV